MSDNVPSAKGRSIPSSVDPDAPPAGSGESYTITRLDADNPDDVWGLAEFLHEHYEMAAIQAGWETQEGTSVDFDDLPRENQETTLRLALSLLQWYDIRPSSMHARIDSMARGDE